MHLAMLSRCELRDRSNSKPLSIRREGIIYLNLKFASFTAYVVLVIAMILLLLKESLFANSFILIAVQLIAALLMIWARITFGRRSFHAVANPTAGGLITSGPYHYIRHPIYASILYFIVAGVLAHPSILNFFIASISCVAIAVRIYAEEKLIVKQYPEYTNYAARTKRLIPFII
jgi:protein-S-isoprenylcysteine O-methyltransferase Ste14